MRIGPQRIDGDEEHVALGVRRNRESCLARGPPRARGERTEREYAERNCVRASVRFCGALQCHAASTSAGGDGGNGFTTKARRRTETHGGCHTAAHRASRAVSGLLVRSFRVMQPHFLSSGWSHAGLWPTSRLPTARSAVRPACLHVEARCLLRASSLPSFLRCEPVNSVSSISNTPNTPSTRHPTSPPPSRLGLDRRRTLGSAEHPPHACGRIGGLTRRDVAHELDQHSLGLGAAAHRLIQHGQAGPRPHMLRIQPDLFLQVTARPPGTARDARANRRS